jgi:hypothetical protein
VKASDSSGSRKRRVTFRQACWAALLTVASCATVAGAAPAGTLTLNAGLTIVSRPGACPAGLPASSFCTPRTGNGLVRGLGSVAVSYTWALDTMPPGCGAGEATILGYPVTLEVRGKGTLSLAVAGLGRCVPQLPSRNEPQPFTIVGGSGVYAGATGSGTVARELGQTAGGAAGPETFSGTLTVPELEFDVVAPVLTGMVPKSVRLVREAKRVRVRYSLAARDAVDGAVRVVCQPRSGTWFPLGRTRVHCSATDSSGNQAARVFVVVVQRRG